MKEIIAAALKNGQSALSEYDSKRVIASAGVPVTREELATSREGAIKAAATIGYPVVCKGCSHRAAHKTELGIVRLSLKNEAEVAEAYDSIMKTVPDLDGVLVQEMIGGDRQFVIGMNRDPQFGPAVMFGIGGIFTEAINDVSFRIAPLTEIDADEMLDEIRMKKLLGEFRGSPAVNREVLIRSLVGIGELALQNEEIAEIDINPLIVMNDRPVVVDALVVLKGQ